MSRVVVVGGGAGGLAVAARLAVRRHDVTLLEQAPTTGGKLATYRQDGFAFDTGPSLLTLPAVYRDLFLKTGGPLEEAVDLQPVEPVQRYEHAAPGDLLHIDTKKLGRIERMSHRITGDRRDGVNGAGWEFLYVAIDDHARIGFTKMMPKFTFVFKNSWWF